MAEATEILLRLVTDLDPKGVRELAKELRLLKQETGSYQKAIAAAAIDREKLTTEEAKALIGAKVTSQEEAKLSIAVSDVAAKARVAEKATAGFSQVLAAMGIQLPGVARGALSVAEGLGAIATKAGVGTGIIAGLVAVIIQSTRSTLSWGRAIYDFALTAGLGFEEAAKLAAVSERVGVRLAEWTRPITMVNGELLKMARSEENVIALTDSTGKVVGYTSKDFARYGVALKDASGATLPFLDILRQMRERYQALPPGMEKSSFLVEAFGYAAANLAPVMNLTNAEFDEYVKHAEASGLVSEQAVFAAVAFDRAVAGLRQSVRGLFVSLGQYLVPMLTLVVKGFDAVVAAINAAIGGALELLRRIPAVARALDRLKGKMAAPELPAFAGAVTGVPAAPAVTGAAEAQAKVAEEQVKRIQKQLREAQRAYQKEREAWEDRITLAQFQVDQAREGVEKHKEALDKLQEAIDAEVAERLKLMGIILDPARMEALKSAVEDARAQTKDAQDALEKARKTRAKYGSVLLSWEEINAKYALEMAEAEEQRAEKALRVEERKERVAEAVRREVEGTYADEKRALDAQLKEAEARLDAAQDYLKAEQAARRAWELSRGKEMEAYIESLQDELEAAQEAAQLAREAAAEAEKLAPVWSGFVGATTAMVEETEKAATETQAQYGPYVGLWWKHEQGTKDLRWAWDKAVEWIKRHILGTEAEAFGPYVSKWFEHQQDVKGFRWAWDSAAAWVKEHIGVSTGEYGVYVEKWFAHRTDISTFKENLAIKVTEIREKAIVKIQEKIAEIQGWWGTFHDWIKWLKGEFDAKFGRAIEFVGWIPNLINKIKNKILELVNKLKEALGLKPTPAETPAAPKPPEIPAPSPPAPAPTPPRRIGGPVPYERGGYVFTTGTYKLHRGELIIPAPEVRVPVPASWAEALTRPGTEVNLSPQFNFDFHVRTREPVEVGVVSRELGLDLWHTYS